MFCYKRSFKKWCATENSSGRFGLINCQKSFAYAFCWKSMVEVFLFALCSIVVLPSKKKFTRDFAWVGGENQKLYVLPCLAKCFFATSFDLWMSKGAYDIFALVIHFLGTKWQPKHITIGLFEAMDISCQTLAKDLIELLWICNLREKIIAYVKDEGFNLNNMTIILKFVVNFKVARKFSRLLFWSCIF